MEVLHSASPREDIKWVWIEKENRIFEEAVLLWGRTGSCTRWQLLDSLSGQKWYLLQSNLYCKISWSSISYGLPAQPLLDESLQHTLWQVSVRQDIFKLASCWTTKDFVWALRRALCKSHKESSSPRDYSSKEMVLYQKRGWFTASRLSKGLEVKMANSKNNKTNQKTTNPKKSKKQTPQNPTAWSGSPLVLLC